MVSKAFGTTELLALAAQRLKGQGFEVIKDPAGPVVPTFLRDFAPSALAMGPHGNLVVEVVGDDPASLERLYRLKILMEGHADWSLEVLFDRSEAPLTVTAAPLGEVRKAIDRVRRLHRSSELCAALLMGFATLEAALRTIRPEALLKALTPVQTVEVSATLGFVDLGEADLLRKLAAQRTAIAHGDLRITPAKGDIDHLIKILESLLSKEDA